MCLCNYCHVAPVAERARFGCVGILALIQKKKKPRKLVMVLALVKETSQSAVSSRIFNWSLGMSTLSSVQMYQIAQVSDAGQP